MSQGILVGSDAAQEWLLPWWWKHYSRHNELPVAFVDFGMTPKTLKWCERRGRVIRLNLSKSFLAKQTEIDPEKAKLWMRWYGKNVWDWRATCFNKPFAFDLTPYKETLWLDLDCEVFRDVSPIFQHLKTYDFAIADPLQNEQYNSGVVVYKKDSSILKNWVQICLNQNAEFCGDDYALTHLITREKLPFQLLPQEWNWMTKLGINFFVNIFHWSTELGKSFIKYHNGIQDFIP